MILTFRCIFRFLFPFFLPFVVYSCLVFLVDTKLYPLPYWKSSNRIPVYSQSCPRYSTRSGSMAAFGLVSKPWKYLIPIPLSLQRSLLPALSCRVGLHRHHFRMNWYGVHKFYTNFYALADVAPVLTMRDFCVWGHLDPYCVPRPQDIK